MGLVRLRAPRSAPAALSERSELEMRSPTPHASAVEPSSVTMPMPASTTKASINGVSTSLRGTLDMTIQPVMLDVVHAVKTG